MASSTTAGAPVLRDLFSKLKSAADPSDILTERAHRFTHNDHKPHLPISLLPVCGTESDVDVPEAPAPAAAAELLPVVKSKSFFFGRHDERVELLSRLVSTTQEGAHLSVIPITGMAGIGKTTLAAELYRNKTVRKRFELKAWVKIDEHETNSFELNDIARKLLNSATAMQCTLDILAELDDMVVDTLLSQRSLIVLDGVESIEIEKWRYMLTHWFDFVGFGSKIIITTRSKQVAKTVGGEAFVLEELGEEDCLSLYSSLAFSRSREITPAAKKLAARCKGVPLYIKLLGSLTRFEEALAEAISSSDLMEIDSHLAIAISVLALPQHLFRCFAYCGIYPCGYMLEREKLIKLWIADGIVTKPSPSPSPSSRPEIKTLEEIAESYFNELLCRSFFTDITCDEDDEIVQARMPSDVHESAHRIAKVMYKDKIAYASFVNVLSSLDLSVALTLQQAMQTLLSSFHRHHHITGTKLSFVELKHLRSLDLSKSDIHKLPKHVCMLKKLKYLNLSNNSLTKLPKSFTNLTRLQTLDLSKCYYLKFLPKKMPNLSKLRHLDLSECNSLCCMPFGIERLRSLITMPLFVLGERNHDHANLDELRGLNKLRGELHIKNLEYANQMKEGEYTNLIKKMKLHNLMLSWSKQVDECHQVMEVLEPNPQLKILELTGYGAYGFPSWMPNLHCLVKLLINDCRCTKLPRLGELQHLKELHLKGMINLRSIGKEFYGDGGVFPSLEKLKLHDLPTLKNWADYSSNARIVFPMLKNLSIQSCPKLQTLPSLPLVTELVVWRSHNMILTSLTNIKLLSSLVVNNMDVKEPFAALSSSFDSVKKLIVVDSKHLDVLKSRHINKFTALKYLRVLQCHNLKRVKLPRLGSLKKLNLVDCQTLEQIDLKADVFTLTELIIEDCPKLEKIGIERYSGSTLRKLIVRNCPLVHISYKEVKGLEFAFITGCAS